MKTETTDKECGVRVEFQSLVTIKPVDGEASSGQGSFVCRYPDGACQLANKQTASFIAKVVRGACFVRGSS